MNYKSNFSFIRCAVPECEDPNVNFTIPHLEDGTASKCRRYAPFRNYSESSLSHNDTCSPHYFDTSTEIECDSYIYFEEHSIVKEVSIFLRKCMWVIIFYGKKSKTQNKIFILFL